MIDTLLQILAPHHCCGCGLEGAILCDNCKYDITFEPYAVCVSCDSRPSGASGLCVDCHLPYDRAWCVAERRDSLEKVINMYKFSNAKAASVPLAALLHESLPELPENVVIVPIPTIRSHIRQRGYDHMRLVANHFGSLRNRMVSGVLNRQTATKQRDANRSLRIEQAKQAFICTDILDPDKIYLLLDDVMTTGATMQFAAKTLREAGANQVWIATISRQPLD